MSMKLRELIRAVRACKTAAEERATIAKECALIRTAFKEHATDSMLRHRNVAKLLYIHMLGYPTHWGQMECLKLIASPRFPEKRIGYLGLMLLLDERQEVLMLVTNSLKNDMHHPNPYVVGLALCSLGNIGSADMCRDLSSEVEKIMRTSNPYTRKKAALCAIRVIRKVPDLVEIYLSAIPAMLEEKNHGVLLSAVTFLGEAIKIAPKIRHQFKKYVPHLVRALKSLAISGYAHDYEVSGITDPFLQVKLLQLLRQLGAGDADATEEMTDTLAHVATNTEPNKNPGHAILYEAVQTIMSIESESDLRVLAINILGRFLQNRENNIRYVALNTLCKVVHADTQAIQRYRNTIVDCLKDADISIRRRALDLIYALVNTNNVRALARELLNYLVLASSDAEFKADLTEKICIVVERFAPSKRWHIDTIIKVLENAGNLTRDYVAADLVILISTNPDLQAYSVHKLVQSMKRNLTQRPLLNVGLWCIGEYGELLTSNDGVAQAHDGSEEDFAQRMTEGQVLDLIESITKLPDLVQETKFYLLNSLGKLTGRFHDTDRLKHCISIYSTSLQVELQQRAMEYDVILSGISSGVRQTVVARVPALSDKILKRRKAARQAARRKVTKNGESHSAEDDEEQNYEEEDVEEDEEEVVSDDEEPALSVSVSASASKSSSKSTANILDDPLDILSSMMTTTTVTAPPPSNNANSFDLISGLYSNTPSSSAPASKPSVSNVSTDDILSSIFGGSSSLSTSAPAPIPMQVMAPVASPAPSSPSSRFPSLNVYNKNGVSIVFDFEKSSDPTTTIINATFSNSAMVEVTNFEMKVAVPKFVVLKLDSPSGSTLSSMNGNKVTQRVTLQNTMHGQKALAVKLKVDFMQGGQPVSEQLQPQFPAGL